MEGINQEMKALYKNETWDTINFLTDKHTKNILREKGTQRTTQSIQGVYKRHLKARTKRRGDTKNSPALIQNLTNQKSLLKVKVAHLYMTQMKTKDYIQMNISSFESRNPHFQKLSCFFPFRPTKINKDELSSKPFYASCTQRIHANLKRYLQLKGEGPTSHQTTQKQAPTKPQPWNN